MNFKEIQPEELMQSDWLDSYNENIKAIWKQLVKLNSNVYCIKRINEFPLDFFVLLKTPFWSLVVDSMVDSSLMIIWRILIDNDGNTLTLRQFRNELGLHFTSEDYSFQFKADSRIMKFGKIDPEIENKIRFLRNNYLAHFNKEFNTNSSPRDSKDRVIYLQEIFEVVEKINSYFHFISFGKGYAETYLDYLPNKIHGKGSDPRSDIEIILDTIAEKSDILNMPENQLWLWEKRKETMSPQGIETLNHYREKFGLNKV